MPRKAQIKPLPYSHRQLHDADVPAYLGESLKMVSFPLGGIGTGTIGLGGRGQLRDWEIFNRPNLGYRPPYTMPYIFCRQGKKTVAKVLERRLLPPFHASAGLPPAEFGGLPRLEEALFVGTYPVARVFFDDDDLPVNVQLQAFNPMIPGNADDSAIPAAVLIYRLSNPTKQRVSGSIGLSMANTVGMAAKPGCCGGPMLGKNVNAHRSEKPCAGIFMTGRKHARGSAGYGTQALVTTSPKLTYATDFDEPGWFDRGQKAWDDFSSDGKLDGPTAQAGPSGEDKTVIGMIAPQFDLAPGAQAEIVFIISWCFPVQMSGWHMIKADPPRPLHNHYAKRFKDAWAAAAYVAANLSRLRDATLRFERTLFDSTLPGTVLDAASSQMAIIRTPTTMWLDSPTGERGGRIFAFEGCNPNEGCCPMNCTHVWNYEQSLAHLYPSLERTMRLTDFQDDLEADGTMHFRTNIPLGQSLPPWRPNRPAADGQFGTVIKAHREWRISGDDEWLKKLWPSIKKSIDFAWTGSAGWDKDRDGVMEGIQHNTYDIEFFGPNTMCGSLYLAALAAGAEMAEAVGDDEAAHAYRQVMESSQKGYDRLFNGEYYTQDVTEFKKAVRAPWGDPNFPRRLIHPGRPKYQYGKGCLSDQLLGQWAAHVAGLGYVLPPERVASAIAAVFRHNFRDRLGDHACAQRVYALGDEGGLLNCTWPRGQREPFPFPYSDEVWTGIEYQVAAHLIYEGFVDEGLTIVQALRDRHDGVARNPFNEFECGDHYARAMASWSVLLALSGQRYDGRSGTLTVQPRVNQKDFSCLYTAADAYGQFAQKAAPGRLVVTVDCRAGQIDLGMLILAWPQGKAPADLAATASLDGQKLPTQVDIDGEDILVRLSRPIRLAEGQSLSVQLGAGKPRR